MCAFTMGMIVVIALCTLIMGLVLGMLGGGGSILTVPILTYLAGMEPGAAVASSLVVVGATSVVGVVMHARSQAVQWTTGSVFGAVAMVGAYGGGRLAALFPGWLLLVLFASMMVATAVMMLRARREDSPRVTRDVSVWMIVAEGLVVGAATGLVGAGGGFLVVPALVVLGGLSMRDAIGTSLLVIALKSTAGAGGASVAYRHRLAGHTSDYGSGRGRSLWWDRNFCATVSQRFARWLCVVRLGDGRGHPRNGAMGFGRLSENKASDLHQ